MPDTLVDTNVLVYAYDPRSAAKQRIAIQILDALVARGLAVLSVQCLTEFYSVVTRRLAEAMSPVEALERVERLSRACRVVELTNGVALEGVRGAGRYRLSPWDALVWAAAKLNQIAYVLTEDADHDRVIEGVRYLNPFVPAFDERMLLA